MPHLSDLNPTLYARSSRAWEYAAGLSNEDVRSMGAAAINPFASLDGMVAESKSRGEFALSGLDTISSHEIREEFKRDLASYEQLYTAAGITMPTVGQMEKAGISFARFAELKEQHPGYELVFTPLIADIPTLRNIASAVTNDQTIPNNPLKKYPQTTTDSDGLWISETVINNWQTIMANTTRDYLASGMPTVSINNGETWTAYLIPSQDKPDNLKMSYQQMKQQGLTTITIPGYIIYQMKRIHQGQKPIDPSTYTWALGEFTNSNGDACAPSVSWFSVTGRVYVRWDKVGFSNDSLGVRSPVG